MKSLLVLVLLTAGCQRTAGDQPAPQASVVAAAPGSDYAKDIDDLCDSVKRSGADQLDVSAHALTIANWLAAHLRTPDSRKFLIKIQPLIGVAKADALDAEAKRVGLTGCALAAQWRVPGAVPQP